MNNSLLLLFQSPATESQLDPDAEEEELKRKLEEFTSHISDREVSSEEEGREERKEVKRPEMNSSSDDIASEARKVICALAYTMTVSLVRSRISLMPPGLWLVWISCLYHRAF